MIYMLSYFHLTFFIKPELIIVMLTDLITIQVEKSGFYFFNNFDVYCQGAIKFLENISLRFFCLGLIINISL